MDVAEFKNSLSSNTQTLLSIVDAAGKIALKARDDQLVIETKDDGSLVSTGDFKVNKHITESITESYPGSLLITEETKKSHRSLYPENRSNLLKKEKVFIVDEIDGTNHYLCGDPLWTVTAALVENGILTSSVTFQPDLGISWVSERGKGAYIIRNNIAYPLFCNPDLPFDKAKIGIGTIFSRPEERGLLTPIYDCLQGPSRGAMTFESTALELASIPGYRVVNGNTFGGTLLGDIHPFARPWDKAAGVLLIRETGGVVTGWPGKHDLYDSGLIAAVNPNIYNRLVNIVTEAVSSNTEIYQRFNLQF